MKKNGRSLKEDLLLIKHGMTEFGIFLPGQLKLLFVYSIIAKSGICLLLSIVLFDLLLILGKRLLLSFFMPFSSHPYFYVEQEPWDKTIYDPYAGSKAAGKTDRSSAVI